MHSPTLDNVVVATVTYGERFHLLKKVVERILSIGIKHLVIVNNGVSYDINKKISEIVPRNINIKVINLDCNYGSAVGFKVAIENAIIFNDVKYLLLLDDDNLVDIDYLTSLNNLYDRVGSFDATFLAIREDRKEYVDALRNGYWDNVGINTFQGFSISNLIKNKLRKKIEKDIVPIAYAPYGGLTIPISLVKKIGLPDVSYQTYGDDHEYTYRITLNGGDIFVTKYLSVTDIEASWYINKYNVHRFFIKNVDSKRLYLSLKNRVRFEMRYLVKNKFSYYVNMVIYLALTFSFSIFKNFNAASNFSIILNSIRDAINESKR